MGLEPNEDEKYNTITSIKKRKFFAEPVMS